MMTAEQFEEFVKDKKFSRSRAPEDSEVIFAAFEPYHDVTYSYCSRTGTVYESRFYIGD